ncbi:ATP-binding protein [Streptomyces catenulae]|uniref:ATP-binding protein n=1 Tax=Streptomyces catenulae TaxID=66875 RepID=A0ABV2YTK2_9ACTN|nr:ATP-binding protein [Streptomyces catenulae]
MTMTVTRPHATGVPGYSETWPCEKETAGRARALVKAVLHTWNLDQDLAWRAMVVASELVTNAVNHSGCRVLRVSVTRYSHCGVRIMVSDKSKKQPEPCESAPEDTSGRGLLIVSEMADRWGTDTRRWGKAVWAELEVDVLAPDQVTAVRERGV